MFQSQKWFQKCNAALDLALLATFLWKTQIRVLWVWAFVSLLTSYLSLKAQTIKYNGLTSSEHNVISGVPQGSILGPLLLTIYTSDILNSLKKYTLCWW